jgi:hypothetical protein
MNGVCHQGIVICSLKLLLFNSGIHCSYGGEDIDCGLLGCDENSPTGGYKCSGGTYRLHFQYFQP